MGKLTNLAEENEIRLGKVFAESEEMRARFKETEAKGKEVLKRTSQSDSRRGSYRCRVHDE